MKKKNWFFIRTRDLFFLTAIAAILVSWHLDRQNFLERLEPKIEEAPGWQTSQACGPPDTRGMGDIRTAWASATQDGAQEWLELSYDRKVTPQSIEIYETFNPGAVTKVTMFDWWGRERVVWTGSSSSLTRNAPQLAVIQLNKTFRTNKVRIYIDSPAVPGWNEIDAVGLVDRNNKKYWASQANASSCYADKNVPMPSGIFVSRGIR